MKNQKKKSIVTELIILASLCMVSVVLVITAINVGLFRKQMRTDYKVNSTMVAHLIEEEMIELKKQQEHLIEVIEERLNLKELIEQKSDNQIIEYLKEVAYLYPETENIFIAKYIKNKGFLIEYDANRMTKGFIFGLNDDFQENYNQAGKNKVYTSIPSLSPITNRTIILSTRPIEVNGEKYVICFSGYIDKIMQKKLALFKIGGGGYGFVIRKNDGVVVAHPDTAVNWKYRCDDIGLSSDLFQTEKKTIQTEYSFKGVNKKVFASINNDQQFVSIACYPESQLQNVIWNMRALNLTLATIFSIVVNIITYIVLKRKFKVAMKIDGILQKMTTGDLNQLFPKMKGNNELTRIYGSVNILNESLQTIVNEIQSNAGHLKVGADQVNKAAASIAEGANLQAANSEEVATSIEEINAAISLTSDSSVTNLDLSTSVDQKIKIVDTAATETVLNVVTLREKLKENMESLRHIKILALNATIEAVKAGEFGKGFSVIAKEIRLLSERVNEYTEDIDDISNKLVISAENTKKQCEIVLPLVTQSTQVSGDIKGSSEEQKVTINQITIAINEANNVTQSNTGTAEELSASAEELTTQTEQLVQSIKKFKLENTEVDERKIVKTLSERTKQVVVQKVLEPKVNISLKDDELGEYENF